jgi:WD40 repeat protein
VDPQSRLVAGGAGEIFPEQAIVRVWDLASGEIHILDADDGEHIKRLEFTDDGDLWVASGPMLRRWNLEAGNPRMVEEIDLSSPEFASDRLCDLDLDGRQVLLWKAGRLWIQDLDTYDSRELSSHAGSITLCSLDAANEIVISSDALGAVLVGPVTGEEPHLLLGHEPYVYIFAVSPDGRWIASGGDDGTIRLWPMPDFSKPPLHTLPHDELLAKLRSLTNLRVVEDPESPSGWKLEVGPFPGWDTVPTW